MTAAVGMMVAAAMTTTTAEARHHHSDRARRFRGGGHETPPAQDVLRQHGIRYVVNAPDGTFTSNCPSCRGQNNFVEIHDDAVGWHCRDCGESMIVRLRTHGGSKPDDDPPPDSPPAMQVIRDRVEDGQRPSAFWNVMLVLKRRGFTVNNIIALLETHRNGIAKKYRGRLRGEVE